MYVREVLKADPASWQIEALNALVNDHKVSVRSGHGVGKSTMAAWSILWYLTTHFPCKVPCTAPTMHQLKDVLWSELAFWHKRMPKALQEEFIIRSSDQDMSIRMKSAPESSFAVGRSGRKDNPEALQGFHSPNLMFIIDEASGIEDIIFEVAGGALSTPDAKVLMTGNPTRTSGYFYDSHTKMRDMWHTQKVATRDVGDMPWATPQYADDIATQYGIDSDVYRVRVLGEFPKVGSDALIPIHLLEAALERDIEPSPAFKPVWGLDVARFGPDRSALAKRRGNALIEPVKSWYGQDTMQTVGRVVQEWRDTDEMDRPHAIAVDVIGIGSGVVDRLQEVGLPAVGVNVAETPTSDQFMRLRDEVWWKFRQWLEQRNCTLPPDDSLIAEVVDIRYKVLSTGKISVESKEEMKKRTTPPRSPDLGDALVLTFAVGEEYAHDPEKIIDRYQKNIRRKKRTSWMSI